MSYCDHPCCDGTHEDPYDHHPEPSLPPSSNCPLCPETGMVLSMEEWIQRDGYRKRAEKIGFPLPKKWRVPPVPLSWRINHFYKEAFLPHITRWLNEPSPLMSILERKR